MLDFFSFCNQNDSFINFFIYFYHQIYLFCLMLFSFCFKFERILNKQTNYFYRLKNIDFRYSFFFLVFNPGLNQFSIKDIKFSKLSQILSKMTVLLKFSDLKSSCFVRNLMTHFKNSPLAVFKFWKIGNPVECFWYLAEFFNGCCFNLKK